MEIKREKGRTFTDEETLSHPAFGLVSLSRVSCTGGINLFGSAIKHGNFIDLTIKRAELNKHLNRDWYFGREELIRISISGTQLGELLCSMNVGDGVPCTLLRVNGESMPSIPDQDTFKVESQNNFKEQMRKTFEQSKVLRKRAEEILKAGAPKKAEKEELLGILTQLEHGIGSNLEYAGKCFDEKVEAMVGQAKGEVEAFIQHKITSAGLEALGAKPIVELEFKEED